MPEETPVNPPTPPAPTAAKPAAPPEHSALASSGPTINIADEFGTAKRNLPPAKIVALGIAAVLLVAGILTFTGSRPRSFGSIDDVTSVEVPDQNSLLVAINVTFKNSGNSAVWIHSMHATLKIADGKEYTDDAASPVDFERYFQAFPALKQHALAPLAVETKLQPGQQAKGTIVVSFPVIENVFSDKRNELTVTIQPYDQRPAVLKR